MLPPRPVQSSKPWNCVTQESINQCLALIQEAEGNWCPERHALFHPNDRKAIVEILRVGRRLEQMGEGIYVYDIFRSILQFVGRGWFEQEANKWKWRSKSTQLESIKFLTRRRGEAPEECFAPTAGEEL